MQKLTPEVIKQLNNLGGGFPPAPSGSNNEPQNAEQWILGDWTFECRVRPGVQLAANLPLVDNTTGDVRFVIGEGAWYWWNGAAWAVVVGDGTVDSVTASAPLSSSGGQNPNISLTGIVPAANGGTGLATSGALGNVLTSNGAGGWVSSAASSTSPGAPLNSVQFNNGGAFGGSAGLTWNGSTLAVDGAVDRATAGTLTVGGTTANAITIGKAGVTTNFLGPVSLVGDVTTVGGTQFTTDAQFDGSVTFGNAATDNVSFVGQIDTAITQEGIAAPAVSPASTGRIYFDSGTNKFRASQNGGAYVDLITGGTITAVTATSPIVSSGGTTPNLTLSTVPVGSGGTNKTSWTQGAVVFAGPGGTSLAEDSTGLFWDQTNVRLGVGTPSPLGRLDVATGQFLIGAGNASVPAIVSRTQTNTGIYFPGIGVSIATAGIHRVSVSAGGNLGVGTTTPTSALSVGASSQFQVDSAGDIVAIRGQTTTFPAANAAGVLTNNGSGTLSWSPAAGGTVTAVTATAPIVSSGGTTPNLTLNTVPVASGGTGATTLAANNVLLGNGGSALQTVAPGSSGNVLTSNGTTWQSTALPASVSAVTASAPLSSSGGAVPNVSLTGIVPVGNGGTNKSSFTAGSVVWAGVLGTILTEDNANFFYNSASVRLGLGTNAPGARLDVTGGDALIHGITVGRGGGAVANNVAVGASALAVNAAGAGNTAVGTLALTANTAGTSNTAVGSGALSTVSTQTDNTAVGRLSQNKSSGSFNTSLGVSSLDSNSGSNNVAIGYQAQENNGAGNNNVSVGWRALRANAANANNAVGYQALNSNSTGSANVAVGTNALASNVAGSGNVAVGNTALASCTASNNVAFGSAAASSLTSATGTTAIGFQALTSCTTAENNTAVGANALILATGVRNVAVGANAGNSITTGTRNTLIGDDAGTNVTTGTNVTCIGSNAEPSGAGASNEFTLGNGSVATLRCQVALTVVSDARDKADVEALPEALPIVADLRPVKYRWDNRSRYDGGVSDGSKKDAAFTAGFLAQDLQQVQTTHAAEWLNLVFSSNPEQLGVTHERLFPLLVKAAQELAAKAQAAEARADAAEARLAALEAAVAALQAR
jgi:hypothetical protein